MASENNDSVWEFIEAFRDEIKQKIVNILTSIRNSKHHIKNFIQQSMLWFTQQLRDFKANATRFIQWSAQNLSAGFRYAWQTLSYTLRNFPQILNQTLHWCANLIVRSFETGYRLTTALLKFLAQELQNLPAHIVALAKNCVRLLEQGFEIGKWLIKNTFKILKSIATLLKDFTVQTIKDIGRACRYVFNNFGTLAKQLLDGIYQVLKELPQTLMNLAKGIYRLGKAILLNIGPFLKELSLDTLRFVQRVATTVLKEIWNVVGITLGAIAAVFDLAVDLFKGLFGINTPASRMARGSHGTSGAVDREVIEMSPRTATPLFRNRVATLRESFSENDQANVQEVRHENRLRRA